MYAMHYTRLHIAFVVCKLLRFMSKSSFERWKAISTVLSYLKKTMNMGLFYGEHLAVLEGYLDAS